MTLVAPAEYSTPINKANPKSPIAIVKPKAQTHQAVYQSLYKFSGLLLFTKDVDRASYWGLIKEYSTAVKDQYTEEIRSHVWAWKRIMKKPSAEDQEICG